MIKQTMEKNSTPPPIPQALKDEKKAINQDENVRSAEASKGQHPPA